MNYEMTPFEKYIARPVLVVVETIGKVLGDIAKAIGME